MAITKVTSTLEMTYGNDKGHLDLNRYHKQVAEPTRKQDFIKIHDIYYL